ncbi:MAG: type IVB secretion system protein IcmH/DotU [Paracoccaceae bacterium]
MNRDDPFAEPTDTDRTVIRPNPAGRRSTLPPHMPPPGTQEASTPLPRVQTAPTQPPLPAPTAAAGGNVAIGSAATGLNALNTSASSLFSLVGRIRNRAQHPNPAQLRETVIVEIKAFENRALQSGIPANTVKAARYALCATIDDVVLNTPWGGESVWTQQSMVGTFHRETHGGDRFYELLTRLEQTPAQNRDLLEFIYVCLSLGFEGRLRVENRGTERHMSIRDGLARLIRTHRGTAEADLSPHWRGLDIAHRALSAWTPIWLTGGIAVGVVCLAFFGFSYALSGDTERLRGQLSALNFDGTIELARSAPPPPPPPPLAEKETLETFLAPEIREGLVAVISKGNAITVRITGKGMFSPASDKLEPRFGAVVDRVAEAVNREPGRIIVAGHSDNIPIRTARFPSNLHLSLARAKSVMDRVAPALDDKQRITAEGRADKDPIATNKSSEGRAQNRRIEIILVKAG